METLLTIDEIIASYPDEWVLLDDLESNDNLTVQRGRVVGHDPMRDNVQMMAIEKRLERCAIVCAKLKDGSPAIKRDYAVSPITSYEEIEAVVANG